MEISNVRALPYFNVKAETTLQTDASKKGLGACFIQNDKVVYYASRALTKTEQNYQNLEREALGTIWGMEKFHYFLYGKEFILETDQKPLVSIYVTSVAFESKDDPTQMTKIVIYNYILYYIQKTIHSKLICTNVHS